MLTSPLWTARGKHLVIIDRDNTMMLVPEKSVQKKETMICPFIQVGDLSVCQGSGVTH